MRQLSFKRHRFPPEIIRHSIWLYARFTLSFRDVEEMLAERGLDVCLANSYSRGDREFEKATAMLFPSEIAQRGRMRDHAAAPFRRRVTV